MVPLQAYERSERQKRLLAEAFRARIIRLQRALAADGPAAARRPLTLPKPTWDEACRRFAAASSDPAAIVTAYGDLVMRYGVEHIDPASADFGQRLRVFHRNYVTNFPLPEEQESRKGFRDLWRASPRAGGYQEVGYSVLCPLTGRYLMGLNFTIQPRSNSVHFIYGFVNPIARGLGGFSARLINLMRDVGRREIAAHLQSNPSDRPPFVAAADPVILFEKNIVEQMSLTEILMDTASINIDHPPRRRSRLRASAISQHLRDFIWDRRGGRRIDYRYLQSSLDGVVRVPEEAAPAIIDYLNQVPLDMAQRRHAAAILRRSLGDRVPGCVTLNLCAFVEPGTRSLPAAQVQLSNEIFQGISVVKDPAHLAEDIYFRAQMASLDAQTTSGTVALIPIEPNGAADFFAAERVTKRLLAGLTWEALRDGRNRSYGEWLREAALA